MAEKYCPTVCLDFDGVIHDYKKWTTASDIPNLPVEGVADFMKAVCARGYDIVVCSSRASTKEGDFAIFQWLKKYDLYQYVREITAVKPPAFAYVDDRGVRFDGDFGKALTAIDDLKVNGAWGKRKNKATVSAPLYTDTLRMLA